MKPSVEWQNGELLASKFSGTSLMLFVLIFGTIGSYILFHSQAAVPVGVHVQGNQQRQYWH